MEIVNIRVDSRLIHGQVAVMWTGTLKATRIMVIDNDVIQDTLMKSILKMACPKVCKLSILDVETAKKNIKSEKYGEDRIFIIVKTIDTLVRLLEQGFPLKEVTIGNLNGSVRSRTLVKTVCVTPEDEEQLHMLVEKGVSLSVQMVPSDPREDIVKYL